MASNSSAQKQILFDRWAASYDWLFPSVFYQAVHRRLLEYVELPPEPNVLDLGCGTGRLLDRLAAQFPGLTGTGADFALEMVRQARRRNRHHPRLVYIQANAEALPFADGQFNAVFNTISFLHYLHPERVFAQVSRVLSVGGRFYLADFAGSAINGTPGLMSASGLRVYSPTAREQLGRQAGLRCLSHIYLLGPILLTVFER